METGSKARDAQIQTASRHVLTDPDTRLSADPEEDIGLGIRLWITGRVPP